MELKTFFDNFGIMAEAPNGVRDLKYFLLRTALNGILTGNRKKHNWQTRRLEEVVDILDSKRVPVSEAERQLRVAGKKEDQLFPYYGATQQVGWIDDYIFDEELVLLGEDGVQFFDPHRPKAYLISGKSWVNNHAHVLRGTLVDNQFLVHCLNISSYEGLVTGTTRLKLNQSKMKQIQIPVPPLAEQKRIVAKVDELMALCDDLEARKQKTRQTCIQLNDACIDKMLAAREPAWFNNHWQRIHTNFDLLYSQPENVNKLRQAILQLAVQGKLVPQDPNDESASVLLEKIKEARKRLSKDTKIKKLKQHPPIEQETIPFHLPKSWTWSRLSDLIRPDRPISYGVLVPGPDVAEGIPFVRVQDLNLTNPSRLPNKKISKKIEAKYKRTRLAGDEILMAVVGSIGKLGVVPKTWEGANIARAVCRIAPFDLITRGFLICVMQSMFVQRALFESTRTLAQPTLNISLIEKMLVPIAPLQEQKRIVAKVDQLMALCDDLEAKLQKSQKCNDRLMEAAVAEMLAA